MKEIDIIQQIKLGEVSKVQFKERLLDNYDIGCELVAFSNARGGTLVVGAVENRKHQSFVLFGSTGNHQYT